MKDIEKKIIEIRRKIHQYPELGNEEFKTAHLIEQTLRQLGIKTLRLGKTGVVGILNGEGKRENGEHCLALRADIDALPIEEKTNKSYRSKVKGKTHACGHDGNTAIVLGTALILTKEKKIFSGTVKFIFQPNEESAGGALGLIKEGVLENPQVETIIGIHVNSHIPSGKIGIRYGEMLAAVDRFDLKIIGEGGHGASPHEGKDAITITSQVIQALQNIVSRQIDPVEPVVITVGTIKGGERFNILAQEVEMSGTVRTLNEKIHKSIPQLIEKTVRSICSAWGAKYKFTYEVIGYPLTNSEKLVKFCEEAAKSVFGKKSIWKIDKPSMGGEDFAEYLRCVPGCFLYLGTNNGKNTAYTWHHPKFDLDETALYRGAKLLSTITLRYLNGNYL